MGIPRLGIVQLSYNSMNNPDAVAAWMTDNVPCFRGKVPQEWTEAVIEKLQAARVDDRVIREAFKRARTKGWDFEAPRMLSRIYNEPFIDVPYISPPPMPAPTMGQGFSESDRRRANIYAAQVYEVRYRHAMEDTRQRSFWKQLLKLL